MEESVEETTEDPTEPEHEEVVEEVADHSDPEEIIEETIEQSEDVVAATNHVEEATDDSGFPDATETQSVRTMPDIPEEPATAEIVEVERQPTIIITEDTIPGPIVIQDVTDEPVTTAASSVSSSSTQITVIHDAPSTTTTEPMLKTDKTVSFEQPRKPRLVRDRGRNRVVRLRVLQAVLGREITDKIGDDIRLMLGQAAGKNSAPTRTTSLATKRVVTA